MLPVGHNRNQLQDIRTTIRDNRFRILKYVYVEYVTLNYRYNSKFKVSMMASSEVGCYPSKRNFPIDFPIGISVKGTMF